MIDGVGKICGGCDTPIAPGERWALINDRYYHWGCDPAYNVVPVTPQDTDWKACDCPCDCNDLYRIKDGKEQYAKAYIAELELARDKWHTLAKMRARQLAALSAKLEAWSHPPGPCPVCDAVAEEDK